MAGYSQDPERACPEIQCRPFLVPPSVLFSNRMLEDLDKIWALRHIIPDPTNPFFSNISCAIESSR